MTKKIRNTRRAIASPLQYLNSLDAKFIRLDLGPVKRILKRLENPERKFHSVLVAGTNGKGSTSAMIASILKEAGLQVGLYTSPHLIDFRERIRMNGRMISNKELATLIAEIRTSFDEPLTYFEIATVTAMLYFCRCKADIAVLEVGMGGRLDATNVVDPAVSVITNISLEHRKFLGNTLARITREKGGIIREDGICLTASRNKTVIETIEAICRNRKAALYHIGKDVKIRSKENGNFSYCGLRRNFLQLSAPLRGQHQIWNAATALGAVEILAEQGLSIPDRAFEKGLEKTKWEGRLEVLSKNPTIVVDGAHNPAGAAVLAKALREDLSYRRLILVFGALRDKAYGSMLKLLAPSTSLLVLTEINADRALSPQVLAATAHKYFRHITIESTAAAALHHALDQADRDDLICVTGSLFLVGEVKKIMQQKRALNCSS